MPWSLSPLWRGGWTRAGGVGCAPPPPRRRGTCIVSALPARPPPSRLASSSPRKESVPPEGGAPSPRGQTVAHVERHSACLLWWLLHSPYRFAWHLEDDVALTGDWGPSLLLSPLPSPTLPACRRWRGGGWRAARLHMRMEGGKRCGEDARPARLMKVSGPFSAYSRPRLARRTRCGKGTWGTRVLPSAVCRSPRGAASNFPSLSLGPPPRRVGKVREGFFQGGRPGPPPSRVPRSGLASARRGGGGGEAVPPGQVPAQRDEGGGRGRGGREGEDDPTEPCFGKGAPSPLLESEWPSVVTGRAARQG